MILSEIKQYLMQYKRITLGDLACHFDSEPEAMRGMLGQWIRKGKVLKLDEQWQYLTVQDAPDFEDEGRGAMVFQPEISFTPTSADEVFVKLGFGAANGLMEEGRSPFALAPWAADVEDGLKDINGRNRDYLLTAWYKHTFSFGEEHELGLTGGIIDATDYLDENAFANDEFSQFMNEALVNGPIANLASYDIGGAAEWSFNGFSIKGVGMAVGSNGEEGELEGAYNLFGAQVGYHLDSDLGEGNYRVILTTTTSDFSNVDGDDTGSLSAVLFSFDQQLGEALGVWLRFGWQDDEAAVVHRDLYSGGLNISGSLRGREGDNAGVGYARLCEGNQDVDHTDVIEAYVRVALGEYFALTGDVQYMKDDMEEGDSPEGWIFGLRATVEF